MKKILVADDEARIRRLVCDFLKNSGYETVEAADGKEAIEKFFVNDIDLVICDIMMPEADGWEVCAKIRETSSVPILMLTARSQEFDELRSFESGADDFVTKPFSPVVLVKRVEALIKRAQAQDSSETKKERITVNGLVIDIPAHKITLDSQVLELTVKEYNILLKLASNMGRIYSREQLLDSIWGVDFVGDPRTVDSHVARLRTKLGFWGERHLKTVYGVGYKIE